MHDAVDLERLGLPAVAIATDAFCQQALFQAKALGAPNAESLLVLCEHPVSDATAAEMDARADRLYDALVAKLSGAATPSAELVGGTLSDECAAGG